MANVTRLCLKPQLRDYHVKSLITSKARMNTCVCKCFGRSITWFPLSHAHSPIHYKTPYMLTAPHDPDGRVGFRGGGKRLCGAR